MADETVEYHVSINVGKQGTFDGEPFFETVDETKWPYVAATFPNEADALECAKILKGFLLGM